MYCMQIPDEFIFPKKQSSKEKTENDPINEKIDKQNSLDLSSDSKENETEQITQQANPNTAKQTLSKLEQSESKNVQTDQHNNKKQKKGKKQKQQNKKNMSTINKQQKKQKFYCRFYMQGSCKNSTNCKFIHPVNVPINHNDVKKQKQIKNDAITNDKSQQVKGENMKEENSFKSLRDFYYERMIDSMKVTCFSCRQRDIPVTLSCGCCTICEDCAKEKKPCCKENHLYDNKIYIK